MAYEASRDDPYPDERAKAETYDASDTRKRFSNYERVTSPSRVPDARNSPRERLPPDPRRDERFQQPRPLGEAVGTAFDQSNAAQQLHPDVMAHIIREVTNTMMASGITGAVPSSQLPPMATPQTNPRSVINPTPASLPPRPVYTPPSPIRYEQDSYGSSSPELVPADADPFAPRDGPMPRHHERVPSITPLNGDATRVRPAAVRRIPTNAELTTLEKIWKPLFSPEGQPTARLGQFLRGLAIHIIEDYEPRSSLVINPDKMLRFYQEVELPGERYPWTTVFAKLSHASISKLYRDLSCQHHLVQDRDQYQDAPRVPALTPVGFEIWMTTMIRAYPDMEHARLADAVLAMPISNSDDRSERFPKELPRRLFPTQGDVQIRQRIALAVAADSASSLPRETSPKQTSSTPSVAGTSSAAPPQMPPLPINTHVAGGLNLERERNPYVGTPSETAIDDSAPSAVPIERERKPYTAQVGGGKVFDDDDRSSTCSDTRRPRAESTTRNWTASTAERASRLPPEYATPTRHQRTGSTLSTTSARRARSPSLNNGYTRSGEAVSDMPLSTYSSRSSVYGDPRDEDRDYYRTTDSRRGDWTTAPPPPPSLQHGRSAADEDYYRRATAPGYGHFGGGGGNGSGGYPPTPTRQ